MRKQVRDKGDAIYIAPWSGEDPPKDEDFVYLGEVWSMHVEGVSELNFEYTPSLKRRVKDFFKRLYYKVREAIQGEE